MSTDAAATLTLRIDTVKAAADLEALETRYRALRSALGAPSGGGTGLNQLGTEALAASQKIKVLEAVVDAQKSKLDKLKNSTKDASSSIAELAKVNTLLADSNTKVASSAPAVGRSMVQYNSLMGTAATTVAELAKANTLLADSNTRVASSVPAVGRSMVQYNSLMGIAAQSAEKLTNANMLLAASNSRVAASIPAIAKSAVQYNSLMGAVGASQVTNSLLTHSSVVQGTTKPVVKPVSQRDSLMNTVTAHDAVSSSAQKSAEHLVHWNKVANDGHAIARGLAGSLGGLWVTYGSLVPLLASAALASSLKSVFTVGKDLEYQFTYIQAITEGQVVSLSKFKEAVQGAMFTPSEAAGGLRVLTQAGLSASDAMKALPEVLRLATVGEVDLAHAALSATSIMHTFGKSVSDISHIGDVFATAARLSATSVKEMMEAMKQASSISNVFGVSLEETAAALATLANRGIEGSAAGTAVRNMVKELASPATAKAAYALEQYGIQIFNADGSAKKFTENLRQLHDVTSVMTSQTKARFLEDMFNERGAKAANILLSDLDKMSETLKEIELSSKGLGFMSEATIRIGQSTEGLIKGLKSNIELTLGEVFKSVEPQIKSIIYSISELVKSSEFKSVLTSVAEAVANLTIFLKDHAQAVGLAVAAYAGFSILKTVGAIILSAVGPFISMGTALGTAVPLAGALATALSGPLAIGLGAVAVIAATVALKQNELDDTQKRLVDSSIALTDAQARLNSSLSSGLDALVKSNALQAERIRLLREGKSAADAASASMDNLGYASAKANAVKINADLSAAKIVLNSPEFSKEDINFNPSPKFEQAFNTYQALVKEAKKANSQLEESASNSIRAGMQGRQKELQDIQEKSYAEVDANNKKFEAIAKRRRLAEIELSEGKFYGTEAQIAARKKTLQADIARGEAASKFSPIDTRTSESESTKVEIARREAFLSANSLSYESKPKAVKASHASPRVKDYTGELEKSTIASNVEQLQENIKVLDIIHKNHLISEESYQKSLTAIYQEWNPKIEQEYQNSIARLAKLANSTAGDEKLQYEKKRKDLETAYRKFLFDESMRSAESVVAEQGRIKKTSDELDKTIAEQSARTQQLIDNLEASRKKLDMTPVAAAGYDAYRDSKKTFDKPIADLKSQLSNARYAGYAEDSTLIKALVEDIDRAIAAQERLALSASEVAEKEAEFAREYSTGWKTAFKSWSDDATNAAKQAADSFSVMSSAIDNALNEFLTTGKINFANFAKSIILDIAKIEAKALLAKASQNSGGFGGIVSSVLGMLGMGGGGFSSGDFANLAASHIDSAKGNVFSDSPSLHQYVNTVQTSPVEFSFGKLHKFARGGIFAEEAPEAVMPLSRDSAGRLGVKAQGGGGRTYNITVNVNGNNNAQDVRRAAGQGAREAASFISAAHRYV